MARYGKWRIDDNRIDMYSLSGIESSGTTYPSVTESETIVAGTDIDNTGMFDTETVTTDTDDCLCLLHFDGDDASTTITDSSSSGHTFTCNGTAQLDTAQKYIGTASLLLDGNSDYIEEDDSADWDLSTDDWWFECWIRFNSVATSAQAIFSQVVDANNYYCCWVNFTSSGTGTLNFKLVDSSSTVIDMTSASLSWSAGTWYQIKVSRTGSIVAIFRNNVVVDQDTTSADLPDLAAVFWIGRYIAGTERYFNGWIDEFAYSKG